MKVFFWDDPAADAISDNFNAFAGHGWPFLISVCRTAAHPVRRHPFSRRLFSSPHPLHRQRRTHPGGAMTRTLSSRAAQSPPQEACFIFFAPRPRFFAVKYSLCSAYIRSTNALPPMMKPSEK
jgi:hypothetical protein